MNIFQSTLPVKGATAESLDPIDAVIISIHAPGEGSDFRCTVGISQSDISIHAPGEGSDIGYWMSSDRGLISIHAPGEGSDLDSSEYSQEPYIFQSTLPVKGATM